MSYIQQLLTRVFLLYEFTYGLLIFGGIRHKVHFMWVNDVLDTEVILLAGKLKQFINCRAATLRYAVIQRVAITRISRQKPPTF